MLGQRRSRRPNIKTVLGECLVGVVSSLVFRLLNQAYTHASSERDSIFKNTMQHSNTPRLMQSLYICQVLRELIENKNDLKKNNKTKMAAAASFSVSHENGQY